MSMATNVAAIVMSAGLLVAGATADVTQPQYTDIGQCRITTYCCTCNDGTGHESSSGAYLTYGHAACNFLPIGTVIDIEGNEYTIVDTCGMDNTIDIFIDDDDGVCDCNLLTYKDVKVKRSK